MDKKAIYYSLDEKVTPAKLKKLENIELDENQKNKFLDYCKKNEIKVFLDNQIFLKKTQQLPYILYYIGDYEIIKNKKLIGVVGPRQMSSTTVQLVKDFFNKIKNFQNIAIVSGLADGVDSLAHNLAIENNIPTVSVLGFGLAKGLAGTTRHLIKNIVQNHGLVLSEFKLKQTGTNWTFPKRNRIIAGLSDVLFVPQAKENSGTLITVEDAMEIKIPIYSCFSSVDDETGKGTNKLITEGKIKGIYDWNLFLGEIKNILNLSKQEETTKQMQTPQMTEDEKLIFQNIQKGNNTVELLCNILDLNTGEILNLLSMMEISGYIQEVEGAYKVG